MSELAIAHGIEWVFRQYTLDLATIVGIATVDLKADELGLLDYCRNSGRSLQTYPPECLNAVTVEERSTDLIITAIGTNSVCAAAVLMAAQTDILLVPKQKFQLDPTSAWVTIAVAKMGRSS